MPHPQPVDNLAGPRLSTACRPAVPPAGRHRRNGQEPAAFLLVSPKPLPGSHRTTAIPKPSLQGPCPQYAGSSSELSYTERQGCENRGRSCEFQEEVPLPARGKWGAALLRRTTEHLSLRHVSPLPTRLSLLLFNMKIPLAFCYQSPAMNNRLETRRKEAAEITIHSLLQAAL